MKDLTATNAARRFSEVLDAVEHKRESFVVTRNGKAVARITPAEKGNGAEVKRILLEHPPDPNWAREIQELRSLLTLEDRDWDG
jgi:prevent-host-death family protein